MRRREVFDKFLEVLGDERDLIHKAGSKRYAGRCAANLSAPGQRHLLPSPVVSDGPGFVVEFVELGEPDDSTCRLPD